MEKSRKHGKDAELGSRLLANLNAIYIKERKVEPTPHAISQYFKVAPNTINNWTAGLSPTMSTLNKVAEQAKREVWELLHPNPLQLEKDLEDLKMYRDFFREHSKQK